MSDLPIVLMLQQARAVPHSGEDLEVMGKQASLNFARRGGTLTQAVADVVKHAGLSPEQVRRVVEFANQSAFQTAFRKEGSTRYVEFSGGPADPAAVLQDLNDGGGGSVSDSGSSDYRLLPYEKVAAASTAGAPDPGAQEKTAAHADLFAPTAMDYGDDMSSDLMRPYAGLNMGGAADIFGDIAAKQRVRAISAYTGRSPVVVKHASLDFDPAATALEEAFAPSGFEYAPADVGVDAQRTYEKIAGMAAHLASELSFLESHHDQALDALYHEVKQAALEGATLGQVLAAWQPVVPGPDYVGTAFTHIGPRLLEEGVFTGDSMGASLNKYASAGMPNLEHPLVVGMQRYCTALSKLAAAQQEYTELALAAAEADELRKYASAVQAVLKGADNLGGVARKAVAAVAGEGAGNAAHKVVKYAPHVAAALAAKRGVEALADSRPGQLISEEIPGTQAHAQRQYYREMRRQGMVQ